MSSADLVRVKGMKSSEIVEVLPEIAGKAVVHRDRLVVLVRLRGRARALRVLESLGDAVVLTQAGVVLVRTLKRSSSCQTFFVSRKGRERPPQRLRSPRPSSAIVLCS